jgi:hypothetical protein
MNEVDAGLSIADVEMPDEIFEGLSFSRSSHFL